MSDKKPSSSSEDSETTTTPESGNSSADQSAGAAPQPAEDSAVPSKVDMEGVRAAAEISMSGGPRPSRFKWGFIKLFISLFKLSAKFFPVLLLLGGLMYSYTYFFGAPPIVQQIKLNPVVQRMAESVGVEIEVPEVDEETGEVVQPQSKLNQMLQQTRDVVAASDSRVNMANAIAGDGFDISNAMADMEEPGEEAAEGGGGDGSGTAADGEDAEVPVVSESERLAAYQEAVAAQGTMRTYSSGDSEWAAIAREEVEAEVVEDEEEAPRQVRDLDYTSFVRPSPAFQKWIRELRIGSVMTGDEPKALIDNMTFTPGSTVDYMLGVTFEGLAENDTLLVFKDRSGAILTVQY